MVSKKGDISINMIIVVIIAIIVLVVVALFFSGYFSKATRTTGQYTQSEEEAGVAACQVACNSAKQAADCGGFKALYCNKKLASGVYCYASDLEGAKCTSNIAGCGCTGEVSSVQYYTCKAVGAYYRWVSDSDGTPAGSSSTNFCASPSTWSCTSDTSCTSTKVDIKCSCTRVSA